MGFALANQAFGTGSDGVMAALTLILGAAYTLWMYKRVVFGAVAGPKVAELTDIDGRERIILLALAVAVLVFGIWPAPLFDMMHASVDQLITHIQHSKIR